MLKAIIFDIGNVLLQFDFQRTIKRISPFCAVPAADIAPLLEPSKVQLESGQLSGSEFLDSVTRVLDYTGSRDTLEKAWREIFTANEPMHKLVPALQVPLYLLSNTNNLHADYFLREYPVFEHFTDAVYSHEAGLMKPDPAIYLHALEKFGFGAEEAFFIDDLLPNVEAARAVGLRTHHYHHERHIALLEELNSLDLHHGVL